MLVKFFQKQAYLACMTAFLAMVLVSDGKTIKNPFKGVSA